MFQIETWMEAEGYFIRLATTDRTMRQESAQEKWESLKKKGHYDFFSLPSDLKEIVRSKEGAVDFVFTGTMFHLLIERI